MTQRLPIRICAHLSRARFFDNPDGKDVSALKPDYRADRFAFGRAEYDWALHNNLRLDTTASELFNEAEPIIVDSRDQMIALARDVARSHKWKTPVDGPGVVRSVFEQLSHDAAPATMTRWSSGIARPVNGSWRMRAQPGCSMSLQNISWMSQ